MPPEEPAPKASWRLEHNGSIVTHGTMRASSPTSSIRVLGSTGGLPHQSEDWFAMAAFGNRKNGLFPTQAAFSVRVIEKRGE